MYTMLLHGTSDKGRLHNDDRYANRSSCVNSQIHCFQIGMTTGLQTYAKYLAAHWLTVHQWTLRHVLTLLNIIIIIIYLLFI